MLIVVCERIQEYVHPVCIGDVIHHEALYFINASLERVGVRELVQD
jgi:hypothetical protein